ncbi:MAG TPA: diacylglycerol kinase family protein [Longimicrobiales bacterium]
MTTPVHVILNPRSGDGAGRRTRPELERELTRRGIDFVLEETERPGHAVELARAAAARGAPIVVAAGGDGTIHEVANGLLQARGDGAAPRPALGIVPIGTGNDFVKAVLGGIDRGPAYDALAARHVRDFDVGRAEWEGGTEYFVNGVGTGIDVEVVRQMRRLPRLHGVFSYLVALVRALAKFDAIPLRIRVDDETTERKVMIIAVANGHCLGGGFYVCPDARPDDGLLDVCIVDELNLLGVARVLPRILRGTHGRMPNVKLDRAEAVEIAAIGAAPLFFQLDGELREPEGARRLRVSVEAAALPVVAPPVSAAVGPGGAGCSPAAVAGGREG